MTNKERVLYAIGHEQPDYTPHNVFFTKQMLDIMVEYTKNPDYIETIDNHICKVSLRKPLVPNGVPEHFTDEFGIEWDLSGVDKDIGVVAEYPLKTAEDLFNFTPPDFDEGFVRGLCERLVKNKKNNFAFASNGFILFERAWSLCGMENLLCYMLTDPEAVECLLDKLTDYGLKKTRIALEYEIDGVIYGDDWGRQKGLIMGAPLWRKFIKPRVERLYSEVREKNIIIGQHSCGDNSEILDELNEMGLNVYQTFQPEIYDLHEYKEKYKGRLTFWGGIGSQSHLPFYSPEKLKEIVKHTIAVMGNGGGYIASPTHDAPGDIPPENIEAMVEVFLGQAK